MQDELPTASGTYLLHFDTPYPNGRKPQHYLGYAENIARRIEEHRRGGSACLMQALKRQQISFTVAATWVGETRTDERKRKNRKKSADFCPICRAAKEKG